jgi:hypothetical protein
VNLLLLLRILTLGARLGLAAALVYLVAVRGGRFASRPQYLAWVAVTVVFAVLAVDNAMLEVLAVATRDLSREAPLRLLSLRAYNLAYLLNAALAAALPLALIGCLEPARWGRAGAWAAAAAAGLLGVGGGLAGAAGDWNVLLSWTRALSFVGVIGFLTFWTLLLLGRLRADAYLIGFLAVETVFVLLLPIQEVFFQGVGREAAEEIWHLIQFLQFGTSTAQLVIVLALLNALARGQGPQPLPLPV